MRNIIASALVVLSLGFAHVANADVIDERVVKAERSLANAQKKLAAARACQQDKIACLNAEREKTSKSLSNAQKRFEAVEAAIASLQN